MAVTAKTQQDRLRELREQVNGPDRFMPEHGGGEIYVVDDPVASAAELPAGLTREGLDARVAAGPRGSIPAGAVRLPESDDLVIPGMPSALSAVGREGASMPTADAARAALEADRRRRAAARPVVDAEREANAARTERPAMGPMRSPARQGDSGVVLAEGGETPAETMQRRRQEMTERRREDAATTPDDAAAASRDFSDKTRARAASAAQSKKDSNNRRQAINQKRATTRAAAAQEKWWAEHQAWQTRMDHAIETGNEPLQAQLAASEPQQPRPDLEATGGRTLEEMQEPVEATLERLAAIDPEAADALRNLDAGAPDSLNANFSELSPDARLQAMQVSGRRLAESNANPSVVLPERTGRFGRPGLGHQLLPPVNLQRGPRSDYTNTPRSAHEGQRGEPRTRSMRVDTGSGGYGPRAAPSPDFFNAVLEGIDIDAPFFTGAQEDRILLAAQEGGMDLAAFDNSPEGRAMALRAAIDYVRFHQDRVGGRIDPLTGKPAIGKSRVVRSGDPNNPYTYAATPEWAREKAIRDMTRSAYEYVGSHPIPDSLAGGWTPSHDGELHPIHQQLIDAAQSGDREKYLELRRQIANHTEAGRRAMLVQDRRLRAQQYQMTNPSINRAVFASAMADAGEDPAAQAAVLRQFGMLDDANELMTVDAQRLGVADARNREWTKLETDRMQVLNPKGQQPPQPDADAAIQQKVDDTVRAVASGDGGGLHGSMKSLVLASGGALQSADGRSRFLRSAKRHGIPIHHVELLPFLEEEWRSGKFSHALGTPEYVEQFVRNVSNMSGYTEDEVRQWVKSNPDRLRNWMGGAAVPSASQPAQAPMPTSMPATVGGR